MDHPGVQRPKAHEMTRESSAGSDAQSEERVPLFGSWRAIHAAVVLCAVAVIVLLALFARWPF